MTTPLKILQESAAIIQQENKNPELSASLAEVLAEKPIPSWRLAEGLEWSLDYFGQREEAGDLIERLDGALQRVRQGNENKPGSAVKRGFQY